MQVCNFAFSSAGWSQWINFNDISNHVVDDKGASLHRKKDMEDHDVYRCPNYRGCFLFEAF